MSNLFETAGNNLQRSELKRLFPTGYMRGACKLAGSELQGSYLGEDYMEHSAKDLHAVAQRQSTAWMCAVFWWTGRMGRALRRASGL